MMQTPQDLFSPVLEKRFQTLLRQYEQNEKKIASIDREKIGMEMQQAMLEKKGKHDEIYSNGIKKLKELISNKNNLGNFDAKSDLKNYYQSLSKIHLKEIDVLVDEKINEIKKQWQDKSKIDPQKEIENLEQQIARQNDKIEEHRKDQARSMQESDALRKRLSKDLSSSIRAKTPELDRKKTNSSFLPQRPMTPQPVKKSNSAKNSSVKDSSPNSKVLSKLVNNDLSKHWSLGVKNSGPNIANKTVKQNPEETDQSFIHPFSSSKK